MFVELEGMDGVEVVGRTRYTAPRSRPFAPRGRFLGVASGGSHRVEVDLAGPPSAEQLALAGDHPEARIDGELRRGVRIRVQRLPAVVLVEWNG